MRFLTAIIDALAGFIRHNPLTVLVIVLLALGAPALLKGIAALILYFLLGIILFAVALMLLFRWKIYKVRRRMEEQFGEGFDGAGPFAGEGFGNPFGGGRRSAPDEGEVKVHRTTGEPRKRVANDVGDYVDFEETRDETKK